MLREETQKNEVTSEDNKNDLKALRHIAEGTLAVFGAAVVVILLAMLMTSAGSKSGSTQTSVSDLTIMDKYDMYMTNEISNALEGIVAIQKVYWLSENEQVAPEPKQSGYGEASSPGELDWLLEEAEKLLDGQQMLFGPDTPVWEGDKIYYYYDETILAITWKQIVDGTVYTMSEVKIAHPSQFRRFLAGGEFGSDKQYVTTEMSASVNAVVATSGDFYKFRRNGIVVYEGQIQRFEGKYIDTCFINEGGDLLFGYRKQFGTQAEAQQFVDENSIRFSLVFGPVLVDDGVATTTFTYPLGEPEGKFSRSAVCQIDSLHYMFVNAAGDPDAGYEKRHTINEFARNLAEMGIQKAYALDGGQTTVICMNDQLISYPDYGTQRQISDIIYFATALPDGD